MTLGATMSILGSCAAIELGQIIQAHTRDKIIALAPDPNRATVRSEIECENVVHGVVVIKSEQKFRLCQIAFWQQRFSHFNRWHIY